MGSQLDDEFHDLGLGTDVEATGRLIQKEETRACRKPSTKDNLLLISATQVANDLVAARGLDVQPVDHRVGQRLLAAPINKSPYIEQGREIGQSDIVGH